LNNIAKKEKPKNIPLVCMLELIKALKKATPIDEYILPIVDERINSLTAK
jgi:hypothetical protein